MNDLSEHSFPSLSYGTPRKLPKPASLAGRVVVLDVAFAAEAGGASFERTTLPFIRGLGSRLAKWVDHHDHARHADYSNDPRFVLCTKAEHGACPEIITPEMVAQVGPIDTICCHTDFDGLCAAAKWIRGGREPYRGADADAHAIDTRIGKPSKLATTVDRALRARPKDDGLRGLIVRFLAAGAQDSGLAATIENAAKEFVRWEEESRRLSKSYQVRGAIAVCDARTHQGPYDKTLLLLLGQERATISVVHDKSTVTVATAFHSGINLVELFGLSGGMPTRISVGAKQLETVLSKLESLRV